VSCFASEKLSDLHRLVDVHEGRKYVSGATRSVSGLVPASTSKSKKAWSLPRRPKPHFAHQ